MMLIYHKLLEGYLQKVFSLSVGNGNCGLLGVVCQNNLLWSRSIFSGEKPLF